MFNINIIIITFLFFETTRIYVTKNQLSQVLPTEAKINANKKEKKNNQLTNIGVKD